jgi:hypothetical protein
LANKENKSLKKCNLPNDLELLAEYRCKIDLIYSPKETINSFSTEEDLNEVNSQVHTAAESV